MRQKWVGRMSSRNPKTRRQRSKRSITMQSKHGLGRSLLARIPSRRNPNSWGLKGVWFAM